MNNWYTKIIYNYAGNGTNKFVQSNSLLAWWLFTGFKKASNFRERISVFFFMPVLFLQRANRDIGRRIYQRLQEAKMLLNKQH